MLQPKFEWFCMDQEQYRLSKIFRRFPYDHINNVKYLPEDLFKISSTKLRSLKYDEHIGVCDDQLNYYLPEYWLRTNLPELDKIIDCFVRIMDYLIEAHVNNINQLQHDQQSKENEDRKAVVEIIAG